MLTHEEGDCAARPDRLRELSPDFRIVEPVRRLTSNDKVHTVLALPNSDSTEIFRRAYSVLNPRQGGILGLKAYVEHLLGWVDSFDGGEVRCE